MNNQFQKFDELLQYPCDIDFRIIVDASIVDALEIVVRTLNEIKKGSCKGFEGHPRNSSNGKYCSYTIPVTVESTEQVKKIYSTIAKLDCVKHII